MNRGVLQSSPVQQMMAAGNPNWWWSINSNMRPPILSTHHQQAASASPFLSPPLPNHFLYQYTPPPQSNDSSPPSSSNSSSLPVPVAWSHDNPDHQFPEAWSQLLLSGLVGDEDKGNMGHFQAKKLENWEDQVAVLHHHQAAAASGANNNSTVDVKQETSPASSYVYGHEEFNQAAATKPTWSSPMIPAGPNSSPTSCVTSLSSNNTKNMLDFSTTTNNKGDPRHPPPDRSTSDQCNGNANGGALKKARVQPSSTLPTFKVRKEKLGDRITTLHQLVSPFGKTDTASVLLEAIGYIRFLQNQIEALSLPYLGSGSSNMRQQQSSQGERSSLFPEDPGQLSNDNCTKRNGACEKDDEPNKDLRSRGLCLVPVSCTLQVGSDNGADYWAPAFGGGFR